MSYFTKRNKWEILYIILKNLSMKTINRTRIIMKANISAKMFCEYENVIMNNNLATKEISKTTINSNRVFAKLTITDTGRKYVADYEKFIKSIDWS